MDFSDETLRTHIVFALSAMQEELRIFLQMVRLALVALHWVLISRRQISVLLHRVLLRTVQRYMVLPIEVSGHPLDLLSKII